MRFYLEHTVQLTRGGMRDLIIANGFNSDRALITKKTEFVSKMWTLGNVLKVLLRTGMLQLRLNRGCLGFSCTPSIVTWSRERLI